MYISLANPEMHLVLADVTPNPDLFYELSLYRQNGGRLMWNRVHGRYMDESDEWEKISTAQFYIRPRTLGLAWAAYLLPRDVNTGDRVFVSELINDVKLVGNTLAADGIAVWTGDGLVFEEEHWERARESKYWIVG